MSGQDGGMVDNGAVLGVVDDIHWNELGAEGKHIQIHLRRHILLQDLEHTQCHMDN